MTNIKLEKVFRTNLRRGERIEESRFLYSEKQFDENGNLLLSRIYGYDGELLEKNVMKYNAGGQRTEREYYVDENEWSEKSVSQFDENGKLTKEIITYMDGSESETTFTYENDKIVSVITVDIDDEETTENVRRVFDDNGKLLKEEKFEYGELASAEENTYNDNGNLILRKTYDPENDGYTEERYISDGDKILSYSKTYPDGRTEDYKNTFDENSNIIRIDFEGEYKSQSLISYIDEHISEEQEILEDGTVLFKISRKFENDLPTEVRNFYNRMGQAPDVEYVLDYEYE